MSTSSADKEVGMIRIYCACNQRWYTTNAVHCRIRRRINFKVYSYFSRAFAHIPAVQSAFLCAQMSHCALASERTSDWSKVCGVFSFFLNSLIILLLFARETELKRCYRAISRKKMDESRAPNASFSPATLRTQCAAHLHRLSYLHRHHHHRRRFERIAQNAHSFESIQRQFVRSLSPSFALYWPFMSIVGVHEFYTEICIVMKENIVRNSAISVRVISGVAPCTNPYRRLLQ